MVLRLNSLYADYTAETISDESNAEIKAFLQEVKEKGDKAHPGSPERKEAVREVLTLIEILNVERRAANGNKYDDKLKKLYVKAGHILNALVENAVISEEYLPIEKDFKMIIPNRNYDWWLFLIEYLTMLKGQGCSRIELDLGSDIFTAFVEDQNERICLENALTPIVRCVHLTDRFTGVHKNKCVLDILCEFYLNANREDRTVTECLAEALEKGLFTEAVFRNKRVSHNEVLRRMISKAIDGRFLEAVPLIMAYLDEEV